MSTLLAAGDVALSVAEALTAFAIGRWALRRLAVVGGCAVLAASLGWVVAGGGSIVPTVGVLEAGWCLGRALHERAQITRRLVDRMREIEQERDDHAELSVRYERARIASEMHDIVAHAISVMVVQASAGQRLAVVSQELTTEAFDAIALAAHAAEADIGRLVTLLADEHAVGDPPELEVIEQLVTRAADTGLDVTLRLEGDRQGLPPEVVQSAARVVREGLTNALRYAAGAPVRVLIRGEPDSLLVEVGNPPATAPAPLPGHGTGNGLRGLRELLDAGRGHLQADATEDGGWLLRARIPTDTPHTVAGGG